MVSVSKHYDLLIENNNDPITDCQALQEYMNKWDGKVFVNELGLDKNKSALEIGCGTGRILRNLSCNYKSYIGIDVSEKTVLRAKEHFSNFSNVQFICADFLEFNFLQKFDVIYSTLTFMHVKEKLVAIKKVYDSLNVGGKFVLSIDKNQSTQIDTGYSKVEVFPDNPDNIKSNMQKVGFKNIKCKEIENAYIIFGIKH